MLTLFAAKFHIKDLPFWLTSYFINFNLLGMQSKHCHWLLDYEHLLLPFCSWISNEIWWGEKKLNEEAWWSSQPISPCMGWQEGISLVLCCLSVITVLQVLSHSVSRDGWEADCFPLPPDDQPVCFFLNLHFFLFKPWIFFFPEKPACLITALGKKKKILFSQMRFHVSLNEEIERNHNLVAFKWMDYPTMKTHILLTFL